MDIHRPVTRRHPAACVRLALLLAAVLLSAFLAGCGGDEPAAEAPDGAAPVAPAEPEPAGATEARREASGDAANDAPLVVFLGDSLTAGYGLSEPQAFPALVAETLRDEGHELRVTNAGVSGDTTAGGLARLDWVLRQEPDVLVVGLGANDGLRGLPLEASKENLRQIVRRARAAGARVLLLGMKIPPSYGADYAGEFEEIFPALADELDVPLVPFLLEGVAARRMLNLPDGVHPNARGQERVAENVAPHLEEILEDL